MHLGKEVEIEEDGSRIRVTSGHVNTVVEKVLVSIGRRPNVERLRLDRLGIELDDLGVPPFDRQTLQVGDLPIFIAGDVNNYRPVLHEVSQEGLVAGYNAVHDPSLAFRRKTSLVIAFTDPNICVIGNSWDDVKDRKPAVGSARFRGGRIKIMLHEGGIIRFYADPGSGRLLGSEMVAPGGEHLAHLLAWCVQKELTVDDVLAMPFYHPTVEETLQEAFEEAAYQLDNERSPIPSLEPISPGRT
jgi:dihydrolipoamide dehydrogenase